jgi:hypothetical protein
MRTIRAIGCMTAAAVAIGMATAGAASATTAGTQTSGDCAFYLSSNGFFLTPERVAACNDGAEGDTGSIYYWLCVGELINTAVSEYYAKNACALANV